MIHLDSLRQRISALKAVCDAATLGPYIIQRFDWDGGEINYQVESENILSKRLVVASVLDKKADADFIISSRTALPQVLEALEVLLDGMEKIAEPYGSDWTHEQCITALRHDEHEAISALEKAAGILGVNDEKDA